MSFVRFLINICLILILLRKNGKLLVQDNGSIIIRKANEASYVIVWDRHDNFKKLKGKQEVKYILYDYKNAANLGYFFLESLQKTF